MDGLLKKLAYKGSGSVGVFGAPQEFEGVLQLWRTEGISVEESITSPLGLALGFAKTKAELDALADLVASQTTGDALIWIAYPKASSKRHRCEFNRDTGWERFGFHGFEPVSQVALDADWSALRMRRVKYIKTLTRGFAMTEEGRRRAGKG